MREHVLARVIIDQIQIAIGLGRTDVDGVVIPVTAGHILVDIGVNARHDASAQNVSRGPRHRRCIKSLRMAGV